MISLKVTPDTKNQALSFLPPAYYVEASRTFGGRCQHPKDFLDNGLALHTTKEAPVLKELLLGEEDCKYDGIPREQRLLL